MLNLAKRLAKVFKDITRSKTTRTQVAIPQRDTVHTVPAKVANIPAPVPTREELTARMVQALQAEVDAKLKAFLDAVENYPDRDEMDALLDSESATPVEIENLVFSVEALGFDCAYWTWRGEYVALCAAIEYHQQNGEEITVELIADVVEAIANDEYVFFPDVHDNEALGSAILDAFCDTEQSWGIGWLLECVDCEELGNYWIKEEGGTYTSRGYFQFGTLEF